MTAEIIADNFAGGGGASEGIEMALGRSPDIAINHDAEALAMHRANHPASQHFQTPIWRIDPMRATGGRPVGLGWFSPDCTHFSKAKGGKPVDKQTRDLAWVVVHWAQRARPRVIILENVEEWAEWGPLRQRVWPGTKRLMFDLHGLPVWEPDPARKGETFRRWLREMRRAGYTRIEWRELRACDYGAPTIRKRLFLIARRDDRPIVWPEPTHGPGRALPFRTAAEIVDWSQPCPSIFLSRDEARAIGCRRPLADATMRRIAQGVRRYVLERADPFIVHLQHGGRVRAIDEPLHTLTASRGDYNAVVSPYLIPRYGERPTQEPRTHAIDVPAPTIVPTANHHLVAAFLAQHNTDMVGHDARKPMSTIVGRASTQAVVASHLINLKGSDRRDGPIDKPMPTMCAQGTHVGEVRAFLTKYFGTAVGQDLRDPLHTSTAKARFGLVQVHGETYEIADIGMRMITPREGFRAQGFRDTYVIDPIHNGRPLTKTAQYRMCGNSVSPPLAAALVRANVPELARQREAAHA